MKEKANLSIFWGKTNIFPLIVFAFLFFFVPKFSSATSLIGVMQGVVPNVSAEVRGTGEHVGACMEVKLINNSSSAMIIEVPKGMFLVPKNDFHVQTMVCPGGERLNADPGITIHFINSFCGERKKYTPQNEHIFSEGGTASGELIKLLEEINRIKQYDDISQGRIWEITDNLDLSKGEESMLSAGDSNVPSAKASNEPLVEASSDRSEIDVKKAVGAGASATILIYLWSLLNKFGLYPIDPSKMVKSPSRDRPNWSLANRPSSDHYWDDSARDWKKRDDSPKGFEKKKAKMKDKGFYYDEDKGVFVQQGMEYDEYSGGYRKTLEKTKDIMIEPEKRDVSRFKVDQGWFMPGDWGSDKSYKTVYKDLEDRMRYLDDLEEQAKSQHRQAAEEERNASKNQDYWLEEQWKKKRGETQKNVLKVQEEKLKLSDRVSQRDMQMKAYEGEYKKDWGKKLYNEVSQTIPTPRDVWNAVRNPEETRQRWNAEGMVTRTIKPIFEKGIKARDQLQQAINENRHLFKDYDFQEGDKFKLYDKILKELEKAEKRGDTKSIEALKKIQKNYAQMRAAHDALVLKGVGLAGEKIAEGQGLIGMARTFRPQTGIRRPSMLDENGELRWKPRDRAVHIADGSAVSPEDISRRKHFKFYAVDKQGNIRQLKGTGNVDLPPRKNEIKVGLDPYSDKVTVYEYGENVRRQEGLKNLLKQRAKEALAKKKLGSYGDQSQAPGSSPSGSSARASSMSASSEGSGAHSQQSKSSGGGGQKSAAYSRGKGDSLVGKGEGKRGRSLPRNLEEIRDIDEAKKHIRLKDEMAKAARKDPTGAQIDGEKAQLKADQLKKMKTTYEDRGVREIGKDGKPGPFKKQQSLKGYMDKDGKIIEHEVAKPVSKDHGPRPEPRGREIGRENRAERYMEAYKKDKVFEDLDTKMNKAEANAIYKRHAEVKKMIKEEMLNDPKWSSRINDPKFNNELDLRLDKDGRTLDAKALEYYKQNLKEQNISLEDQKWVRRQRSKLDVAPLEQKSGIEKQPEMKFLKEDKVPDYKPKPVPPKAETGGGAPSDAVPDYSDSYLKRARNVTKAGSLSSEDSKIKSVYSPREVQQSPADSQPLESAHPTHDAPKPPPRSGSPRTISSSTKQGAPAIEPKTPVEKSTSWAGDSSPSGAQSASDVKPDSFTEKASSFDEDLRYAESEGKGLGESSLGESAGQDIGDRESFSSEAFQKESLSRESFGQEALGGKESFGKGNKEGFAKMLEDFFREAKDIDE
jgi:hypothetical protein